MTRTDIDRYTRRRPLRDRYETVTTVTLVGKNIEEGAQKQEKQYVFRLGIETVKNSGENSRK